MHLLHNNKIKIALIVFVFIISVIGFMVKLPNYFFRIDKQLHSGFYFLAAAFLNILFSNKKWWVHVLIFILLYLFGVGIEYAQEYSNKLVHAKIHGRYDPQDIKANLYGLIAFSCLWLVWTVVRFILRTGKAEPFKQSS